MNIQEKYEKLKARLDFLEASGLDEDQQIFFYALLVKSMKLTDYERIEIAKKFGYKAP